MQMYSALLFKENSLKIVKNLQNIFQMKVLLFSFERLLGMSTDFHGLTQIFRKEEEVRELRGLSRIKDSHEGTELLLTNVNV